MGHTNTSVLLYHGPHCTLLGDSERCTAIKAACHILVVVALLCIPPLTFNYSEEIPQLWFQLPKDQHPTLS